MHESISVIDTGSARNTVKVTLLDKKSDTHVFRYTQVEVVSEPFASN